MPPKRVRGGGHDRDRNAYLGIVKMLETAERDGKERTVRERRKVSAIGACMTPARAKKQVTRMVVMIMMQEDVVCAGSVRDGGGSE